jgi:nitrogen fixation NifU-like protein
MHIKWNFINDKLYSVVWNGEGCAIFKSSVDIFLEHILNKSKKQIIKIANEYEKFINQKPANEKILGKLIIYKNVKKQFNRLICANIISQSIIKNLK